MNLKINPVALRLKRYIHRLNTGSRPRMVDPDNIPEETARETPVRVNILLFITTFFTTTFMGGEFFYSGSTGIFDYMLSGLPYSATLMTILLFHEFGHYFASRKFNVNATLPFFIPLPFAFGTMGAIIKTRSPIPHRKALFYIGAMGPLPGFIVSLAAIVMGIHLSEISPMPWGIGLGIEYVYHFGDSLLFFFVTQIIHGPLPAGYDLILTPYAFAGWIGLLITSLNLMPIGQLDGGHIMYSLIGRRQVYVGWAAFIALIVLSVFWYGWVVWIIMTLLFLMIAHPHIPRGESLTIGEKILGWLCMLILLLTFIPRPINII